MTSAGACSSDVTGGFEISGEAVEIKGPCSFCRHKELIEVSKLDEADRPITALSGDLTGVWTGNLTFSCVSARSRCLKTLSSKMSLMPSGRLSRRPSPTDDRHP